MLNKKNIIKNKFVLYPVSFVCLILAFLILLIAAYSIPNSLIKDNAHKSMRQCIESKKILNSENRYVILSEILQASPDYFSDLYILKRSLNGVSENANEEESRGVLAYDESSITGGLNTNDINELQTKSAPYRALSNLGYARYWHGTQIIIKPLMVFLNYQQMKFFGMFVFYGLFAICLMKIYKKLGMAYALAFLGSMVMVKWYIIPMTIHFPPPFIIAFITILIIFHMSEMKKITTIPYILFIAGCVVNFIDLHSTPLVTLGLPLAIAVLLSKEEETLNKKKWLFVVKSSIAWFFGFSLTWISKWCIATLVLGRDVIHEAISQAVERTGGDLGTYQEVSAIYSIKKNLGAIFNDNLWLAVLTIFGIVATIVIILVLAIKHRRFVIDIDFVVSLGLIAIIPLAWLSVLQNATIVHYGFVYRIFAISILTVFCILIYLIKANKKKLYGQD